MCNDIDTDATFEVLYVSEARRACGDQRFVRCGDKRRACICSRPSGRLNCSFLKSRWNLKCRFCCSAAGLECLEK